MCVCVHTWVHRCGNSPQWLTAGDYTAAVGKHPAPPATNAEPRFFSRKYRDPAALDAAGTQLTSFTGTSVTGATGSIGLVVLKQSRAASRASIYHGVGRGRYSLYSLYWCTSANTGAAGGASRQAAGHRFDARCACLSCVSICNFVPVKLVILTQLRQTSTLCLPKLLSLLLALLVQNYKY